MHERRPEMRVVAWAAALLLLGTGGSHAGVKDLVGRKAPGFSSRQVSGEPWSFPPPGGKAPVLLTFWSIYCKSCTEELSALARLVEKKGPGVLNVVAVNEDIDVGIGRVKNFLEHFEAVEGRALASVPVLFDTRAEIFRKYEVSRLPTLVYIDGEGIIREVIEGYGPGKELAVSAALDRLLAGAAPDSLREVASESVFDLEVKAPICGVYRDGAWYRPLDLDESGRPEAIARARARGEEYLTREAIRLALSGMGIDLRSEKRPPECGVSYGMEIRTPATRRDTMDLLLERLSLPRILEVVTQETIERDRSLVLYRRIRVLLPPLVDQMTAAGFDSLKRSYRLRFVRASFPEQMRFVEAVEEQFPYLSEIRPVLSPRGGPEYRLEAYAASETVVRELKDLDVGTRNLSVELLPGEILEVAMWR